MRMSLSSRREYFLAMSERYRKAKNRAEKTKIMDEVVLGYRGRDYAKCSTMRESARSCS